MTRATSACSTEHLRSAASRVVGALTILAALGASGCADGDAGPIVIPGSEEIVDATAPRSTVESTATLHDADEPCRNGRPDERGEPFPADDAYVDDRVPSWDTVSPADAGFDVGVLESTIHDVGLNPTVLSLLVVRDGRLAAEEYFNGAAASHAHNIFSTTKLLTALAMGAAIEDGIVPSLETTLGEWVPETAEGPAADVTLQQMLSMRSGLAPGLVEPFGVGAVGAAELVSEPGAVWEYATNNSELLALGLDRRTTSGWCTYLHDRVLSSLDVDVDHWHETPYGNTTGGSYAFVTPRELARLGQLLLDGGRAGGADDDVAVPAEWIDAMTSTTTDLECRSGPAARSGRSLPTGYGMHLVIDDVAGYRVWQAGGYGGQAVLVVPDLDLVVVVTQEVGPVFERRLAVLDTLEFGVLAAITDAGIDNAAPCPTSGLVVVDDGPDRLLAAPAGGSTDWSPDGDQIVFGSDVDLNSELYVVAAAGGEPRRITDDGATDALPRWSPDGRSVAFASDRGRTSMLPQPEFDLWVVDVESGATRALTDGFGDVLGHSWSPDGDRLIVSRAARPDLPGGDLWTVDAEGGHAELFAAGDYAWPEWSPDGETIAAVTRRGGEPVVVLIDRATGVVDELATGDLPRWSPDGRSLLVTRSDEIVAIRIASGSEEVVTDGCCASVGPRTGTLVVNRQG